MTVSAEGDTFRYASWMAGANNDCPSADAPTGVVSVTVFGAQVDPAGTAFVTLCLPRPDLLEPGVAYPLSPDVQPVPAADRVQLIDVQAAHADGCRWTLTGDAPSGTATVEGLCGGGVDPAGFALTLDGAATVTEACAGFPDRTLTVTLSGTTSVVPM